jgi:hypothetical protein
MLINITTTFYREKKVELLWKGFFFEDLDGDRKIELCFNGDFRAETAASWLFLTLLVWDGIGLICSLGLLPSNM